MEFHLPKFKAQKGARTQEIILDLGLQPGLRNHFHQVATPTRGKAAAHQPRTICLTLWRRVNCSNQRTTQLPGLHLKSRFAKKKQNKKQNQKPDKFSRRNTQGFGLNTSWQHLGWYGQEKVNLINTSQQERTAWVCSIPNQLGLKGPGNVITTNRVHRNLLRLSQGALSSLKVDISSGLPSDRQH